MAVKEHWGGPKRGWLVPTVDVMVNGQKRTIPRSVWEKDFSSGRIGGGTPAQRATQRMWLGTTASPKGQMVVQQVKTQVQPKQPSPQTMLKNTLAQAFKPAPTAGMNPFFASMMLKSSQPKQNVTRSKLSDPNYLFKKFLGR